MGIRLIHGLGLNINPLIFKYNNEISLDFLDYDLFDTTRIYDALFKVGIGKEITLTEKVLLKAIEYYNTTGHYLNIIRPRAFSEKSICQFLFSKIKNATQLGDKILVKEYIQDKLGREYTIPNIAIFDTPEQINYDLLPNSFVLKVNWGCGQNIVVKDKTKIDRNEINRMLSIWLRPEFNNHFIALDNIYKDIKPKILCEEYMVNSNDSLSDYKFYCIGGKIKYVAYISNRLNGTQFIRGNYNKELSKLLFIEDNHFAIERNPENISQSLISQMGQISEILSNPYPQLRVDFYVCNNKIYIGELVPFPFGGMYTLPREVDLCLGQFLDVNKIIKYKIF